MRKVGCITVHEYSRLEQNRVGKKQRAAKKRSESESETEKQRKRRIKEKNKIRRNRRKVGGVDTSGAGERCKKREEKSKHILLLRGHEFKYPQQSQNWHFLEMNSRLVTP